MPSDSLVRLENIFCLPRKECSSDARLFMTYTKARVSVITTMPLQLVASSFFFRSPWTSSNVSHHAKKVLIGLIWLAMCIKACAASIIVPNPTPHLSTSSTYRFPLQWYRYCRNAFLRSATQYDKKQSARRNY